MTRRTLLASLLSIPALALSKATGAPLLRASTTEWDRCKADPVYFIETYCKIKTVHGEEIPFKLYDWQKEAAVAFQTKSVVAATPRQAGKTDLTIALILHRLVFGENVNAALMVRKLWSAKIMTRDVADMYRALPDIFKPESGVRMGTYVNGRSFTLPNGNQIVSLNGDPATIAGSRYTDMFFDEAAYLQPEVLERAALEIYMSNSRFFMTSTPKGVDEFYRIYKNFEGNRKVHTMTVRWNEIPGKIGKDGFVNEFTLSLLA